jgi:uncharacterized phage protein gp47/JayE
MPWYTPTLRNVRELVRGEVTTSLGRASFTGNSALRVLADAQAALAHLVLKYIDWLSLQLLPDTAETEWLDRHGDIWLVNADGSTGRKAAALASGSVTFTGVDGSAVPQATQLSDGVTSYETTAQIVIGTGPTEVGVIAINPGTAGNHLTGDTLEVIPVLVGVDGNAIVVKLTGGTEVETDDQLRERVLRRIRQPPMGGAAYDYEAWALAVPGVTRAWAAPEQGTGTITVRFLMDDLRADDDGWPTPDDVQTVHNYINTKRPVAVKDCYVLAPIKQFIDVTIENLQPNTVEAKGEIEKSLRAMLFELAAPGQTIFAAWISMAILNAPGVVSFKLVTDNDNVMPSLGHMAVLGTLLFNAADDPNV